MTIAGVYASGDRGFAWADVELLAHGRVSGRQDKVIINLTGGFAMVTVGLCRVLEPAATAALRCSDFDEACRAVPAALRATALKAMDRGTNGDDVAMTAVGLVGYSARHRAVVAFEADGSRWFEPQRVRAHLWCGDAELHAELAAMHPETAADITGIAVQQLAELQRAFGPDAGLRGDELHAATVTRDGVRVERFRLPALAPLVPRVERVEPVEHAEPAEVPALRLVPHVEPATSLLRHLARA